MVPASPEVRLGNSGSLSFGMDHARALVRRDQLMRCRGGVTPPRDGLRRFGEEVKKPEFFGWDALFPEQEKRNGA
jgi:hypothetical protein